MSLKIDVSLSDSATPELRRIIGQIQPGGGLGQVLGRALANTLKAHFRERNRTPNRLGGKRTNFWSRVGQGVQNPVVGTREVTVTVSHPAIRQKLYGGKITAKPGKSLAIPVHPAAYGNSPRVFSDLTLMILGVKRTAVLAKKEPGGGFTTFYLLKKFVTQEKDPATLPPESRIVADLVDAVEDFLA